MGFMGISAGNLLIILLIILILFGAKKVPELAKGLGSGIREFKKAAKEAGAEGEDVNAKAASSNSSEPADSGDAPSSGKELS
jgi:sec-independent protein translocase protein TatA